MEAFPKNYVLTFAQKNKEFNAEVMLFKGNPKLRRVKPDLRLLVEFYNPKDNLLRPFRIRASSNGRQSYIQPREFISLLRNARRIIINSDFPEEFKEHILEMFRDFGIKKGEILKFCKYCLADDFLTVLGKDNTFYTRGEKMCWNCVREELDRELQFSGANISPDMKKRLWNILAKKRDLESILTILSPNFDPAKDASLTLYDTIEADEEMRTMSLEELPIPLKLTQALSNSGIVELMPVQISAIEAGLLKGENLLIVSSTTSGKTLIGELAGLPKAFQGKKMIYLAPLVALANQKYLEFKTKYEKLGIRTAIRVGMSRIDVGDEELVIVDSEVIDAHLVSATYEALDYLLRLQRYPELGEIETIIVDEIQMLDDEDRGPELDGIIIRLRELYPDAQIICLSATVSNAEELAENLGLKPVVSNKRPVPLERHLILARNSNDKIKFIEKLVRSEFKKISKFGFRGQTIVFTYSRRRAHRLAEILRDRGITAEAYHAGLTYAQRKRIETGFTTGIIAAVFSTAALGAGVDFPASQVIFESLTQGREWITVADFEQMAGRAGRYGKHERGKVVILIEPGYRYNAAQEETEDEVAIEILRGKIEAIYPNYTLEQCAEQLLASISVRENITVTELKDLYEKLIGRTVDLDKVLDYLEKSAMIFRNGNEVTISPLGRAATVSFLTPAKAVFVKENIDMDPLELAIRLEPFESVYLSSRVQAELNRAYNTNFPTRFFSGAILDIMDVSRTKKPKKLEKWVLDIFANWILNFFNCKCKDNPFCECSQIELAKKITKLRFSGLKPSNISQLIEREYELYIYSGDIFRWLDSLVHNLRAVCRIAEILKKNTAVELVQSIISRLEKPILAVKKL
ncbi:MAG: DUF5814 domain-containing protein [Candidatus Jordarchaeum sp.]|uniref:DUF5814 domain-containing protein n=1 Tax=Candidatus Jordarchaeum sp. TaxID=2823881 RepID=UPI00404A0AA7